MGRSCCGCWGLAAKPNEKEGSLPAHLNRFVLSPIELYETQDTARPELVEGPAKASACL